MSVLMFLDGVLRKFGEDKSPITEGTALYKSISDRTLVRILADNAEEAERWFKVNGMAHKLDDIVDYVDKSSTDKEYSRVDYCRARGKIDYVVTPNPELAKRLLEEGVTVYLFMHPKYIRPEFRPDSRTGVKSWESILEELDRQQELYSEDPRI